MNRGTRRIAATAAVGAAWIPGTAHAHLGPHQGDTAGLLHAMTQPDHLLALMLIGAAVLWAPRFFRRVAALVRCKTLVLLPVMRRPDANSHR